VTDEPASRTHGAAFYAVRALQPGHRVVPITVEGPSLLMRGLDLQVGHKLAWSIAEEGGRWRTVIQHCAGAPPRDVLDLLQREHQRLDSLLARALRLLNPDDVAAATPALLARRRAQRRSTG